MTHFFPPPPQTVHGGEVQLKVQLINFGEDTAVLHAGESYVQLVALRVFDGTVAGDVCDMTPGQGPGGGGGEGGGVSTLVVVGGEQQRQQQRQQPVGAGRSTWPDFGAAGKNQDALNPTRPSQTPAAAYAVTYASASVADSSSAKTNSCEWAASKHTVLDLNTPDDPDQEEEDTMCGNYSWLPA